MPAPGSFDFLGFTHFWSRSKKGFWVVKRKTAGSRFQRALKKIADWCRLNRHLPIAEQHQALGQQLRGHYAYYGGLMGKVRCLQRFRTAVHRIWYRWLSRRRRQGVFGWARFKAILRQTPLPWPSGWVPPCAVKP